MAANSYKIFFPLMSLLWFLPFFVRDITSNIDNLNFSSLLPHIIFLVLFAVGFLTCVFLDKKGIKNQNSSFKKLATLNGLYVSFIIILLVVVTISDSYGLVSYFGGDAGGSFMLFALPSIVVYLVLSLFLACLFKRKKS